MNTIKQLIQQYCPEGVEYRKLGECCNILDSQRKPVAKGKRNGGIYPYYGANGVQDYVDAYIFDGTFLLVGEDGSVINTDKSPILNWAKGKIWVNNHAHVLSEKENVLLRYLYFALQCTNVSDIVRGTPPKLNQANLRNIEIPLPPLPIQHKIVEILDNFTELEAELEAQLEAELEARKKQYTYYREQLLSFKDDKSVEWKALGEISEIHRGVRVVRNELEETGKIPVFQNSLKPLGYYNKYNCPSDSSFVISAGAAGDIGFSSVAFWAADDCLVLNNLQDISQKFLFYCLEAKSKIIKSKVRRASIPRLSKKAIEDLVIPIPSLSEQRRIVSILDRFESFVNDISSGLPAEIKARHQQYEYYRDQLLSFKRK